MKEQSARFTEDQTFAESDEQVNFDEHLPYADGPQSDNSHDLMFATEVDTEGMGRTANTAAEKDRQKLSEMPQTAKLNSSMPAIPEIRAMLEQEKDEFKMALKQLVHKKNDFDELSLE